METPMPTRWSGKTYTGFTRLFTGPNDIRDTLIDKLGIEWVASYLDPCDWRESDRTIIPNHAFAATKIRERASGFLRKMNVNVLSPKAGTEARYTVEELCGFAPEKPSRRRAA